MSPAYLMCFCLLCRPEMSFLGAEKVLLPRPCQSYWKTRRVRDCRTLRDDAEGQGLGTFARLAETCSTSLVFSRFPFNSHQNVDRNHACYRSTVLARALLCFHQLRAGSPWQDPRRWSMNSRQRLLRLKHWNRILLLT